MHARYWARSFIGWPLISGAQPNAAHLALARWERSGRLSQLLTQNVDGLHERAGSGNVVHLHGSLFEFRCSLCDERFADPIDLPKEPVEAITPPPCPVCGGPVRPSVVWFGEALPQDEWNEAERV